MWKKDTFSELAFETPATTTTTKVCTAHKYIPISIPTSESDDKSDIGSAHLCAMSECALRERESAAAAEMNDYSGGVCIQRASQHLLQLSAPATILFAPFTIVISPDGGGARSRRAKFAE